jgi:hypothetical protein
MVARVDFAGDQLYVDSLYTGAPSAGSLAGGSITSQKYVLTGVNFNAATNDNAITLSLPSGTTRYLVLNCYICHASASISTATAGLFTAASGGGVAVAADQAITVTSASDATNNNAMALTITNSVTRSYTASTLYFRTGTAQGSAATGDVVLHIAVLT